MGTELLGQGVADGQDGPVRPPFSPRLVQETFLYSCLATFPCPFHDKAQDESRQAPEDGPGCFIFLRIIGSESECGWPQSTSSRVTCARA